MVMGQPVKKLEDLYTESQLEQLGIMGGLGIPQKLMAAVMKKSLSTFEEHLQRFPKMRKIIDDAKARAVGKVAQTAFEMAVSGNHPAMTMFYLKCQGRWKQEVSEQTHVHTLSQLVTSSYKIPLIEDKDGEDEG